jgi:hypothetical protein
MWRAAANGQGRKAGDQRGEMIVPAEEGAWPEPAVFSQGGLATLTGKLPIAKHYLAF